MLLGMIRPATRPLGYFKVMVTITITITIIIIIIITIIILVLTCGGHVVGYDPSGHQTLGVLGGGDDGEQTAFTEILDIYGWDFSPHPAQLQKYQGTSLHRLMEQVKIVFTPIP